MKMNKVMTGVGAAMAVGSVAAMATGMMSGNKSMTKMYKKKAGKAMKSMNNMMNDFQYMFK